ncbi:Zinc finger C-x8-C-x5-C-x3-H type (and similar) [Novymonas esmeraldas]|uniref:Zinc finger C-x8-C-x5-C-x3-H type (And similar) n=1 Tax=Novymonas esmeraldas TaxID=1808958 RepID=A0AAW0EMG8_9TRYP
MSTQLHASVPRRNGAMAEQHKRSGHAVAATGDHHVNHNNHHHHHEEDKHILADRYKTKLCKNYVAKGECPYEVRCMFAHGEAELRTSDDNVRDGLISEDAIKAFQRQQNQAKRRAVFTAPREQVSHPVRTGPHHHHAYEMEESGEDCDGFHNHHHHHNHHNIRVRLQLQQPAEEQQQQQQHQPAFIPMQQQQQHNNNNQELENVLHYPRQTVTAPYYTHNPYAFDLIPAAARLFPIYHEMAEAEDGYWYAEEEPMAVAAPMQEDYYFPSSDMMMPLVPSSVTQQPVQYAVYGKQLENVASASAYSGEEAAYGQSEASSGSAYAPAALCAAAELPGNADIPAMVMEP